ncbi:hypothetical protein [Streptomyces sp. NPDC058299]|uniref:hypothetical protein n=1 Tax=unclassified Streptomyces TaxID=2593676 RepID=UPI0036E161A5
MGTQITDSISKAENALLSLDIHAQHVRQVAMRILGEHAASLPELLAIHVEATDNRQRVGFQPRTVQDARQWAAALGVELTVTVVDAVPEGWRAIASAAEWLVDGVQVRIGSYQSYSPEQWAERSAAAVAA